jgi:hypothetical protein
MKKPYSNILVALLKGVVYRDDKHWDELAPNEADIKIYFADIYLDVIIDKSEGYAYLKQRVSEDEEEETPKLIEKRQLNFHVSLLCLLLRKHLIENDSEGESTKAYLTRDEILNLVKTVLQRNYQRSQSNKTYGCGNKKSNGRRIFAENEN